MIDIIARHILQWLSWHAGELPLPTRCHFELLGCCSRTEVSWSPEASDRSSAPAKKTEKIRTIASRLHAYQLIKIKFIKSAMRSKALNTCIPELSNLMNLMISNPICIIDAKLLFLIKNSSVKPIKLFQYIYNHYT